VYNGSYVVLWDQFEPSHRFKSSRQHFLSQPQCLHKYSKWHSHQLQVQVLRGGDSRVWLKESDSRPSYMRASLGEVAAESDSRNQTLDLLYKHAPPLGSMTDWLSRPEGLLNQIYILRRWGGGTEAMTAGTPYP
jgi:hypothetical protein